MKKIILALIVFIFWSYLATRYYVCNSKNLCVEPIVEIPKKTYPAWEEQGLLVKDQKRIKYHYPEGIVFFDSNSKVEFPKYSSTLKDSLFRFLNKNQSKELRIESLYLESDSLIKNPNLGLRRVQIIKDSLIKYGLNPERIELISTEQLFSYDSLGRYEHGIRMYLEEMTPEKIAQIDKKIINKLLYSKFGAKTFNPDRSLQGYIHELKNYLNRFPEKKAYITGHTDDVGSEKSNKWVGMGRAENLKKYLISEGIKKNRIITTSKGELDPIADNSTEEGRAKNRRIEINVK